jgi:Fur family ferric uptake transcriptional regulator
MKKPLESRIDTILTGARLRRTAPRIAVLSVLIEAAAPITQDCIASALGRSAPNKVTIYRTLETFLAAGIVHKAFLHDRTWHFELANHCTPAQCHPHLTCTNCGETHCLPDLEMPTLQTRHKGFIIHRRQTRLEGLCPKCSNVD